MSRIVSVQDISCFGQCSLTVAHPILSAFGIETAILPSAILSNHTSSLFSGYTVLDLTDEMPRIIHQWEKEGIYFDAIYTGYIGNVRQFEAIKTLRKLLLPGGKLIVDPAMADNGLLYKALDKSIVDGMRSIVRTADLILPNLTEACLLTNTPYKNSFTKEDINNLLVKLSNLGCKSIILTGIPEGPERIGAIYYDTVNSHQAAFFTERQPHNYHGTGDIFASVAISQFLKNQPAEIILEKACTFVNECIIATISDPSHSYGVKFETVLANLR